MKMKYSKLTPKNQGVLVYDEVLFQCNEMRKRNILSKQIFLLYLYFIFKFPIQKDDQTKLRWLQFYTDDRKLCPNCFLNEFNCENFFLNEIEFIEENLADFFNILFGVRNVQFGRLKFTDKKVVVKYLLKRDKLQELRINQQNVILKESPNFCSDKNSITKFVEKLDNFANDLTVLFLLNINIQPLLLKILEKTDVPVQKLYKTCGFIAIESYEGRTLVEFYQSPFRIRLSIALELLNASLKFTNNTTGFRIYLTDANPDNIVVNTDLKVSIIDLDNILIVDGNRNQTDLSWKKIHKYERNECIGCFAYIPAEICNYHLTDINIFSICQILREDLYGNTLKGFLHSIPYELGNDYNNLDKLLYECVFCNNNCENRFVVANQLIKLIEQILV